jgi:hypothetical protein
LQNNASSCKKIIKITGTKSFIFLPLLVVWVGKARVTAALVHGCRSLAAITQAVAARFNSSAFHSGHSQTLHDRKENTKKIKNRQIFVVFWF